MSKRLDFDLNLHSHIIGINHGGAMVGLWINEKEGGFKYAPGVEINIGLGEGLSLTGSTFARSEAAFCHTHEEALAQLAQTINRWRHFLRTQLEFWDSLEKEVPDEEDGETAD